MPKASEMIAISVMGSVSPRNAESLPYIYASPVPTSCYQSNQGVSVAGAKLGYQLGAQGFAHLG